MSAKSARSTFLQNSSARYLFVSVLALGFDFLVTFSLRLLTPMSLPLCAAIGFVVTAFIFYFIHEYWTFQRDESRASAKRLGQHFLVIVMAFTARVASIALLEWFYPSGFMLGVFYFAVGVILSFSINFLANKYWVFSR